ncbi:peptidoglycan/LPS O-acetylase OafA/YrhL [Sphingomonas zeicaulis]|uniref:acyltransferase family protein n=1 Tax=Sphingomonas zeicaulis TaxID=1632740 RepID=UPI003D21E7C3
MLSTIQAGRGVAALAVVMFHLTIMMGDARYGGDPVLRALTWRGDLGVDFFFVLSGFIMMFIHAGDIDRPARWTSFARARFVRLFPIYWLYTAAFCVFVMFGFGRVVQLPTDAADWLSVVLLVRLTDVQPPLNVAWTLFHEIAFYGVFSLLILDRRVGAIVLASWMIAVALAFTFPGTGHPTPLQTYFAACNLDFLIGMIACVAMRHAPYRVCLAAFWCGMGLLAMTLGYEYGVHKLLWSGLLYGLAFGGIIAGMTAWEARRGGVRLPLAKQLGDASYTIYLIHVPVTGVLLKLGVGLGLVGALPGELVYFGVLALALALGYAAHALVEKPLQNRMRRHRAAPDPALPAAA